MLNVNDVIMKALKEGTPADELISRIHQAEEKLEQEQKKEDKAAELAMKAAEAFYNYLIFTVPDFDTSLEEIYDSIRHSEEMAKQIFSKPPTIFTVSQKSIEDIMKKLGL